LWCEIRRNIFQNRSFLVWANHSTMHIELLKSLHPNVRCGILAETIRVDIGCMLAGKLLSVMRNYGTQGTFMKWFFALKWNIMADVTQAEALVPKFVLFRFWRSNSHSSDGIILSQVILTLCPVDSDWWFSKLDTHFLRFSQMKRRCRWGRGWSSRWRKCSRRRRSRSTSGTQLISIVFCICSCSGKYYYWSIFSLQLVCFVGGDSRSRSSGHTSMWSRWSARSSRTGMSISSSWRYC